MDSFTQRNILKMILLCQLTAESIEETKETTIYSKTLKNLINKLEYELHRNNRKNYNKVYSLDVMNGLDVIDLVIDKLINSVILDVKSIDQYNLIIVNTPEGQKKIKTNLTLKEFEKKYNLKKK